MARQASKTKRPVAQPRASITFPPNPYKTLGDIAKKNVPIAWVVREAAQKYVALESVEQ